MQNKLISKIKYKSSRLEVFCKKDALKNFAKATGKQACNFIKKETLVQVFFCELCKVFKNTVLYRAPPLAASENKNDFLRMISWSGVKSLVT